MTSFWVSCLKFTIGVEVDHNGTIVDAAPIATKFIGQPFENLTRWAAKFGGLIIHDITKKGEPKMASREERIRREREERGSTARRRAETHGSGYSTSTLKVPEGVGFFSPEKGVYRIDILPYKVGRGNPYADPGMTHYERTFWIYRNIGPEEKSYICPSKTFNRPDFIQEFRQKESRKEDADADYLKSLSPKERQIFLVFVHSESQKGIQLWEYSYHNFGKLLDQRIKNSSEAKGWDLFYYPDDLGFTLEVTFAEADAGTRKYIEAVAIDFDPREKALPDELVNHGYCLDDFLVEMPYEKLKAIFLGQDVEEEAGGNGKVGEHQNASGAANGTKAAPSTAKTEPPKEEKKKEKKTEKPKLSTAMDAGLAKGTEVTYGGKQWEIMRISGDGTSLTLIREEDGDDVIEKAIGIDEVRKVEAGVGATEEETPFEGAVAGKAAAEKEFDDDWD